MLKKIKQYFCKHKMEIEKYFMKHDIGLFPNIDCYYKICIKCKYIDESKCGYKWSEYYISELKEMKRKYIVELKWDLT